MAVGRGRGDDTTTRLSTGAGLLLVAVIGLVAGGLTFVTERAFCAVAPDMPLLGESCATDPGLLAVAVGVGVGAVALIGWARSRRRSR